MENTNDADLGTAQNNPTNNEVNPQNFGTTEIADIFSKQFLGGEEPSGNPESPETQETAEVEATAEQESTVLSQEEEAESEEESFEPEKVEEDDETERGLPKGVKKRIDKLTAKRREAEAEIEKLKMEVERLSQEAVRPAQIPNANNPFANLRSMDEVSKEAEQAKQIRRWCEMNPDGAVVTKPNGEEVEYTAEDVRTIKIKAMDALEEHLPKQAQYINALNQYDAVAQKDFSWWKDRSSKERQMAETFIKAFPEILRAPDHKLLLGHIITGIKVYEGSKKGQATLQKAPAQPKSSVAPVPLKKNQVVEQVAKQRYNATNSRDDLSAIIASKFL
jgi:hypothetical protein